MVKRVKKRNNDLILAILFISILLFAYMIKNLETSVECHVDSDCATGGCSGEVCGPKISVSNVVSTCMYRPEYSCLKYTSCRCIEGRCQWELTPEYKACLDRVLSSK